ncbi:SERTA domain-containing protein 4 [Channa argus]|uniref:SERTA domain-containing protein 4 n=1 Tax=Channa argus TaxID=215402 RepID=A0A6G1QGS0_CHAAH|nr:SERTA domain-containing protein 4 [Channa argus]
MTLVLSMNPFLDPEGDPPPYQPIWESGRRTKACLSNPVPPCSSEEQFTQEPPCRRVPDHVSVSRIAYFKRKFVDDDEEPPFSFRTYCQTVSPVLEERAHVLRLSLEKMRFIDDPEAFLRRSVLVNNLLRRLRAEILLQSTDWCFPPNPAFASGPCVLPPSTNPAHQPLHGTIPARICLAPQAGPPFRKRFRMVRGGQGDVRPDCAQTCCCIYAAAAAAGHYLHLPFSMYDATLSTCQSTPHSSFFQLASHSKLGLTMAVDDEDEDVEEDEENEDEEEREDEEEEEDDERRQAGPSIEVVKDNLRQKSRTGAFPGHAHTRTEEESCMTGRVEEDEEGEQGEEEEDEEEEHVVRPSQWDSERELHKGSFWHRRAHRQ